MTVRAAHRRTGVAVDRKKRHKDDFYPEPESAVEALYEAEDFGGDILDPACGLGTIPIVFKRLHQTDSQRILAQDIKHRGYPGTKIQDFLKTSRKRRVHNVVCNPPFKDALKFLEIALRISEYKVAFFVKLTFLESAERGAFFAEHPPARVWVFKKRVKMWRGRRFVTSGKKADNGGTIAFCWVVWDTAHKGPTQLGWI